MCAVGLQQRCGRPTVEVRWAHGTLAVGPPQRCRTLAVGLPQRCLHERCGRPAARVLSAYIRGAVGLHQRLSADSTRALGYVRLPMCPHKRALLFVAGAASQVHVSQDFYELVDMPESYWHRQATVSVKNLGQVRTWYHDPLLFGRQPFQAESPRLSAREASEPEGVAGSGDGTITLHSMSYERSRALLKAGSDH